MNLFRASLDAMEARTLNKLEDAYNACSFLVDRMELVGVFTFGKRSREIHHLTVRDDEREEYLELMGEEDHYKDFRLAIVATGERELHYKINDLERWVKGELPDTYTYGENDGEDEDDD